MDTLIYAITFACIAAIACLLINGALVTARMSKKERRMRLEEFDDAW